jgi:uncharacterized protein YecE (DUF72 family)
VIRVGTAGWSYADWAGVVHPRVPGADFHPLRHLARYVECVEVVATATSFPAREAVQGWLRVLSGAPELAFTAVLHRDFTHRERADSREELERQARAFLAALEPLTLARRLAALLVSMPRTFQHGAHEVRKLGSLHALFGSLPLVLEVRHASWFTPPALSAVRGLGYSLAYLDLPEAWDHPPAWFEPTGPIGYLRLHGRNQAAWFASGADAAGRRDHLYAPAEIAELAARAKRIAARHERSFVIANNPRAGKAVVNAIELLAALRSRPVLAPPELVRAYPRLRPIATREGQQPMF